MGFLAVIGAVALGVLGGKVVFRVLRYANKAVDADFDRWERERRYDRKYGTVKNEKYERDDEQ